MLEAKRVVKATVPSSLLPQPSPASIQPTRLALHVNHANDSSCSAYFATGCRVYKTQMSMEGESLVNRGKDNLLIPAHSEVIRSSVLERCPHRSEIQSVALTEMPSKGFILGSVDSYGHLIVSELDADGIDVQKLLFAVSPQDCGVGEGSWAGLSFSPSQWCMVAVARSFPKCIDIYDQEICLRNICTLLYPSSLTFVENQFFGTESSILAVTEGCQLTMWDLRMKENGGCLQRICGSPGNILYAASISSMGNIAVGGADRSVTIYDPRKWSVLSRWNHCAKYEITGLEFSSIDPNYIYVQGVDHEVFCGQWSKRTKIFSFRGDSNWLGFTKCPDKDRDILAGWCDSGSIFVTNIVNSS
ncbi:hypothetical protein SOVF_000030 isoform A [Spinacia oleracea]|nr:hypothetical protein SOVF_000030 isoform A [Spinacia oleracea]